MDFVKLSRFQLFFWWTMAGGTLVVVSVGTLLKKLEPIYFILPVTCVLLALLRRWQLRRILKSQAAKQERETAKNKR